MQTPGMGKGVKHVFVLLANEQVVPQGMIDRLMKLEDGKKRK
jgi:hypothetical protein